jgi:hypothetical protein
MSASIRTLLDTNNDLIYPKTKTAAVYDDNNNSLNEVLLSVIRGKTEQGTSPIEDPVVHKSDIEQTPSTDTNKIVSSNVVKNISDNLDDIETNLGDPSSASGVTGADAFSKINTLNSNLGDPSSASSVTGADAFSKISTLNSDLAYKYHVNLNDTTTKALPQNFRELLLIAQYGNQRASVNIPYAQLTNNGQLFLWGTDSNTSAGASVTKSSITALGIWYQGAAQNTDINVFYK